MVARVGVVMAAEGREETTNSQQRDSHIHGQDPCRSKLFNPKFETDPKSNPNTRPVFSKRYLHLIIEFIILLHTWHPHGIYFRKTVVRSCHITSFDRLVDMKVGENMGQCDFRGGGSGT